MCGLDVNFQPNKREMKMLRSLREFDQFALEDISSNPQYISWTQGPDSIYSYNLTSKENSVVEIRLSHDRIISSM